VPAAPAELGSGARERAGKRNTKRTQASVVTVVIVVLAVAVIGGVRHANAQKQRQQAAVIGTATTRADCPVTTAPDAVVLAGNASAPIEVDAYEGFVCSACRQFFHIFEKYMSSQMSKGTCRSATTC
jgi:protein-disulfide isomerase